MNEKKQILFVMPVMKGGGAEKVAAVLLDEFCKSGYKCELALTNTDRDAIVDRDIDPKIKITVLRERSEKKNICKSFLLTVFKMLTSFVCKVAEFFGIKVPAVLAERSFYVQNYYEVRALKKLFEENPDASIISFLQPSIPMTVLAARGLNNRVILSERADPYRLLKKRYGYNFIKKYYQRADAVVFQTNDAKAAYPENISAKGTVIFNPVNNSLPEPYFGERNKYVTTFCRISRQKNLPLLVEAFSAFHKDFDDYRLKIIGAPQNEDDIAALDETKELINKLALADCVDFLPFSKQVHGEIITDAMYINSSDYEGMSNAMLEAMAIGMPVVCTDCPIGGAAAVIKNGENGLLARVGDAEELAQAMKKIASDKLLADRLSRNAAKIRDELSLENTARKWMELL